MLPSNAKKSPERLGFTALEVVSLIVLTCIMVGALFTWFSNQKLKSKAAEAQTNLKLIFNAEMAYYETSQPQPNPNSTKNFQNTKQFLPLSPQPATPGPQQQVGNFSSGDWSLLQISIPAPVYFSYSVETAGFGEEASFTAIAKGDLDGDQRFSRWEMLGSIDVDGKPIGGNIVYSLDPLE